MKATGSAATSINMFTLRTIKKLVWILLPIGIGLTIVGIIFLTDIKGANIVARVKIETLIIGFTALLSIALAATGYLTGRNNKLRSTIKNEQQQQAREEHQRFILRLDHELKNPLTALQLGLENLRQDNPAHNTNDSILALQTQTHRLAQLTGDLRKLAAFDQQSLELEPVNIADLLTQTKELTADLSSDRHIQLTLPAAPWPVPNILADRDLLQLALYNIIENAIKYSDKNDRIEVRASDDQNWVKIEISDTGLGIAQRDVENVWKELYRGDNGRHRKGTGIGLSLVRRIIERHNGEIQLESKEGMGTRVTLSLPTSH